MDTAHLAGVVVAGGAGRRLGGADKPMLRIGGEPLLARAVRALEEKQCVLVGTPRPGFERMHWTVEQPPGSGPVAAVAAGLAELSEDADPIAVLAGDLIAVTAATVRRLCVALETDAHAEGAVLVDQSRQRQWLISVWRAPALRAALPERPAGVALRAVLGALRVSEVAELPGESLDIDTPGDLDEARGGPSQDSYR